MYRLRNLLDKNPIQISGAVMALLNLLVIVDVVSVSADAVAASNTALILVLGLFVTTRTTNTAKLEDLSEA